MVGEKLRNFRQKNGITQKEIAESIGIDQRQWSKYEVDKHEFPIRYLLKICEIYETTPNEILGFDDVAP